MSISEFFSADSFMPHGHCYLWRPAVLWLHVISDVLIAAAYFSIPAALIVLVRRRRDLAFNGIFYLFAVFILGCGLTHVMEVVTTWLPYYGVAGALKAVTAAASIATALTLWPLLPKIMNLPSFTALDASLRTSEMRFSVLANSIPQLAWMAHSDGKIFWYNQRWYNYTGTTLQEVEGWGWQSLHHPDHVERVTERFKRVFASGEPWEDTFPLRSKDNEWRWFLSRAQPVRDESGQITYWFGTNTDITEERTLQVELERAKELAEASNRAKSEFLANMSHEIRTPLNAVLGFTALLLGDDLSSGERQEFQTTVSRNGKNLTRLIDDILDLSKIEAGQLRVETIPVATADIIQETLAMFQFVAAGKGLVMRVASSGSVPPFVDTDPTRLRQILVNIVGNAVKFSDRGTIEIVPSWQDSILTYLVIDEGSGIAASDRGKLFNPFTQADSSMTRKYGGTGLGLALSRRLARALGGDLELRPAGPGPGCTFAISVAAPASAAAPKLPAAAYPPTGDAPNLAAVINGLRVLVAEDAVDNQIYIRRILERGGSVVDVAADGATAVELALKGRYDLILMDMQMPILDGYRATEELRRQGYSGPVIALTAHALPEERAKSLAAGCDGHLTKPVSPTSLAATIAQYTARAPAPA